MRLSPRGKKCTLILLILIMGLTASATVVGNTGDNTPAQWRKLSQLNDPPNKPSKAAALAATQGMTRAQIKAKHFRLTMLYKQASAHANGTALQILRREIDLLSLAGAE